LPAGYTTPDTEILLLDDNGYNVSAGEVGEIAIKSRYHAAGYWQREDLTKTRFLPDPEGGDRRVYLTGDLGRRQADGCVEHLGRKDFQVKIRGYTVSMGTIEAALLELEAVKEALVVARENQTGNHQLVAYLVPSRQAVPTVTALRRVLAQTLPTYMIPTAFVTLKSLPLTATGKIDRRSLPDPDRSRPELDTLYVSPRSPLEKKVAQIWAEVLSVEEVGIHDNFFDLGGHSVAATRVLSQVIQKFQLELPLRLLFQSPTVAEMAAVIAKHQGMNPGGEELARILTELESLSDEEAKSQLGEAMRHRRQV